jgi:TonB family protein
MFREQWPLWCLPLLGLWVAVSVGQQPPVSPQPTPSILDSPAPNPKATAEPENSAIPNLLRSADQAVRNRDYSTCAQILERVVAIDPNYKNAWNYLGWTYNALGQYTKAESALRQAIAANPADPQAYNNLGQALAYQKRYEEAIPQYLKQIEVRPKDPWAHANLGRMYIFTKQYQKAVSELEIAANITPDEPNIPYNLGRAYAKLNEPEKAVQAFAKSVELQPIPARWNGVAYEMVVEKLGLEQAKSYSRSAIAATVQQMRDTTLEHPTREDVSLASRIASNWDTWGWIQFQAGNLPEAERYVKSAWLVHALPVNGDHLGQIYEKEGRKAEALEMYQMVLGENTSYDGADETRVRLTALAPPGANAETLIEDGKKILRDSRTLAVRNLRGAEGLAEFWILLSPRQQVRGAKFANGDETVKGLESELQSISYPDVFPEATEMRLLLRGRLTCLATQPDCRLFLISAQSVTTDEMPSAVPSTAGGVQRIRLGGKDAGVKLIKKVQPEYPPLARQTRIEGMVQLHTIIAKDGTVKQLEVISGHPLLVQAAIDAVRQWVYEPTLLNGQAVEVDTTVDVFFQLRQ